MAREQRPYRIMGAVQLDVAFIERLIQLPEGAKIVDIRYDNIAESATLMVEGVGLPLPRGALPVAVRPIITQFNGDDGAVLSMCWNWFPPEPTYEPDGKLKLET